MVAVADLYGSTGFGVATASVAPPVLTAQQLANASRTQAQEALETGNADAAKQVGTLYSNTTRHTCNLV